MLFSSPDFFAFIAVYFLIHCLVPARFRNYLIIAGSTIFYAWWKVEYVALPYLLMFIAYGGVQLMSRAPDERARRGIMAVSIAVLFVPLLVFKYSNFFYIEAAKLAGNDPRRLFDAALPLGVSFVTFTLTAYIVDIYKGTYRGSNRFSTVLSYVLFFPHLIAGPILRPSELLPQLERPRRWRSAHITAAISIFTLGLVKKLAFADQMAEIVDKVYGSPAAATGYEVLLSFYAYSIQIYCDFSGYTDMAIGLAMLLGVRLPNNFSQPYLAMSLVEFWRRWHLTLSFWLRDYLYIPLGGSRFGLRKEIRNVMITMVLGGLWHGANWTFIVWGFLHGAAISVTHILNKALHWSLAKKIPRWLSVLLTFHFVSLAWVFFRAPSMRAATEILGKMLHGEWSSPESFVANNIFLLVLAAIFFLLHPFDDLRRVKYAARTLRKEVLLPLLAAIWIIVVALNHGSSAKFIYFDF